MTKGIHLSPELRRLIKTLFYAENPIDTILTTIIGTYGPDIITKSHLQKLIAVLRDGSAESINREFPPIGQHAVVRQRANQRNLLSREQKEHLLRLRTKYVSWSYKALRKLFLESLGEDRNFVSEEIVRKICIENGYSRKALEFRNCKQDPAQQLVYVKCIRHVAKERFVSIDGMVQSCKDYNARRGYARQGQRAVQTQFVIRDKSFAVMVACTVLGIIAFQIFEGNVTAPDISYFIDEVLAPKLFTGHHFAILDNARNQNNQSVRDSLEAKFEGLYCFLSPYSPEFAPAEGVIQLVKAHVRVNESSESGSSKSELDLLEEALLYYSIGNTGAASVVGFFNKYGEIHDIYLRDLPQEQI
jgi:transposase